MLILIATVALFALGGVYTSKNVREVGPLDRLLPILVFIGMCVICIPFYLGIISSTALFLGSWGVLLIAHVISDGLTQRNILVANTMALCFMLAYGLVFYSHLVIQTIVGGEAVLATAYATGEEGLLVGNTIFGSKKGVLLSVTLGVSCIFLAMLGNLFGGAFPTSKEADRALQPYAMFLIFAMANELLDALPLSTTTWFDLMPYFHLGGTLLLTLFFFVVARTTTRLGFEVFRESENIALERKRRDQEIQMRLYQRQADTDTLTGLTSRRKGQELLAQWYDEGAPCVVAFIDADGLKRFNDLHGHAAGDRYLTTFAEALSEAVGDATAIRWGGDEFVVVALAESGLDETKADLAKRLDSIKASVAVRGADIVIHFSYGIATSKECATAEELLHLADSRMYENKQRARSAKNSLAASLVQPKEAHT